MTIGVQYPNQSDYLYQGVQRGVDEVYALYFAKYVQHMLREFAAQSSFLVDDVVRRFESDDLAENVGDVFGKLDELINDMARFAEYAARTCCPSHDEVAMYGALSMMRWIHDTELTRYDNKIRHLLD
ncbi:hypothetical protein NZD89_28690 (plasmid) [Alicyclobacillus fastidiosus]|uniref:Uncharacterized protein n=1 Tax=Alicyclobacillus fastidiosus TaxID=392011 RepID=A0ABY6ZPB8_9BACL|nr:hypothetical protein [Alicyclobacillus fastidiosus]WAH44835.1 hypothetical protein NZD89_28690 [Alicyclobacillus fastidiosus]GMA65801.1 hypothetical protein GCM10025859_62410 [Alicyclobacillus fastidiosus]GMA65873.1 hypothetical protein GCM10025859_63140 [Alicyclobacillus fastidiosus]